MGVNIKVCCYWLQCGDAASAASASPSATAEAKEKYSNFMKRFQPDAEAVLLDILDSKS